MIPLPEPLEDILAAMRSASTQCAEFAGRIEAATALQPSVGGVVETMINHARDPHCIGCYVVHWNDGEPLATCNECGFTVALLDRLASPAQADGWVLISESEPPRNECVVYWHLTVDGSAGFPAIADEWRAEHHAEHASHWHPSASAAPSAPRGLGG